MLNADSSPLFPRDFALLTTSLLRLNTEIAVGSVNRDMRINKTLAAILLATAALFQVPASAHTDTRAKLQVRIVDQTNAVLSHATVTLFTLDGNPGVTLTSDEKGIVLFPSVASGLTQIVVKYPGFSPAIDKATLKAGDNTQTVMLHLAPFSEKVTVKATPSSNRS